MTGGASPPSFDFLDADRFSALGDWPVLMFYLDRDDPPPPLAQSVKLGLDRAGTLPAIDPAAYDVLLTSVADAPAPWVTVEPRRLEREAAQIGQAVRDWPHAATILCQVLRIAEGLPFCQALELESLAYSALLGGTEFARWKASRGAQRLPRFEGEPVEVTREDNRVTLTLNQPAAQNAMTAGMRDALYAALANCLDDPSEPEVLLTGAGRCFSTGGALGEFGSAGDLAQAHAIRTLRSCAALLDRLGPRASVLLHGACVGSGLEVPAAAARRIARKGAWFQLPELRMGLIPGAGGTASVARAIGRHRTAWMVLSGKRIGAEAALDWGLVRGIAE